MTYVQTPFRQALRRVPPVEGETATAPEINAPLDRGAARRVGGSFGIRHKKTWLL